MKEAGGLRSAIGRWSRRSRASGTGVLIHGRYDLVAYLACWLVDQLSLPGAV